MLYIVTGADGAEIKSYKTLAAAKKFAEGIEGATITEASETENTVVETMEETTEETVEAEKDVAEEQAEEPVAKEKPVAEEKPVEEKPAKKKAELKRFKVAIRINIRKAPSLEADKVGAADVGTILEAYEDLGDWLKIKWKGGTAYARHAHYEYIREV